MCPSAVEKRYGAVRWSAYHIRAVASIRKWFWRRAHEKNINEWNNAFCVALFRSRSFSLSVYSLFLFFSSVLSVSPYFFMSSRFVRVITVHLNGHMNLKRTSRELSGGGGGDGGTHSRTRNHLIDRLVICFIFFSLLCSVCMWFYNSVSSYYSH